MSMLKNLSTIFYIAPQSDISQGKSFFELHDALASRRSPESFSLQNLIFLASVKRS
jgi:hypothetical protein